MTSNPKTLFRPALVGLSTALALTSSASAVVLSTYGFNGGALTATTSSPTVVAGVVTLPGEFDVSTSTNMVFFRSSVSGATLASAIAGGADATADYLQVTIRAAAGQTLSLQSLVFDHLSSNDQSPFTSNFAVFASLDGFATAPTAGGELATSSGSAPTSGAASVVITDDFTVSLTDPAFQNLTDATTVTFRFYGFDTVDASGAINRLDNIVINGVPEPSALLLFGSAALLPVFRRRR